MRILLVSPRYIPHIGGVEYVVKSIAERLAKMGHDVIVLTGEPSARWVREEIVNNVKIIRWPTWTLREAYHIPKMRNKLVHILRKLGSKVDVIHIHSAHAVLPVYVGIKAKKIHPNIKLIFSLHYHAHGHTLIRELAWRILWRRYVEGLIRYADIIHAVSIVEAERVVKHYPAAKDKLVIIPNGIDEDVFQYKWKGENSDYIIYAGRIEKYKRLEVAIDLVTELNRHGHDLKLLIVGKGPYLSKLKQYAQERDPRKVKFKLPLSRKEYLEAMANAFATINPSYYEAFSIFIAESLAIGTPAIVSHTIARIYKEVKSKHSPFLVKLKPVLNKFDLIILTNDNRKIIKTWDNIIREHYADYT